MTRVSAQLRVADLLAAARSKTGLTDFGDEWFGEEGLDQQLAVEQRRRRASDQQFHVALA